MFAETFRKDCWLCESCKKKHGEEKKGYNCRQRDRKRKKPWRRLKLDKHHAKNMLGKFKPKDAQYSYCKLSTLGQYFAFGLHHQVHFHLIFKTIFTHSVREGIKRGRNKERQKKMWKLWPFERGKKVNEPWSRKAVLVSWECKPSHCRKTFFWTLSNIQYAAETATQNFKILQKVAEKSASSNSTVGGFFYSFIFVCRHNGQTARR